MLQAEHPVSMLSVQYRMQVPAFSFSRCCRPFHFHHSSLAGIPSIALKESLSTLIQAAISKWVSRYFYGGKLRDGLPPCEYAFSAFPHAERSMFPRL